MIEPRHHTVPVVLDFVQPAVTDRRRVDQLRELRHDPVGKRRRPARPPARYGARHDGGVERLSGRRMRLLGCGKARGSVVAEGSEFKQQICQTISRLVAEPANRLGNIEPGRF